MCQAYRTIKITAIDIEIIIIRRFLIVQCIHTRYIFYQQIIAFIPLYSHLHSTFSLYAHSFKTKPLFIIYNKFDLYNWYTSL